MAHVQWCVGNTTLREARRLKNALRVLYEHFDQKEWSYANQKKFLELLATTKLPDSDEPIYEMSQTKQAKQIEQHGRTWASTFNELGFATCYKKGNEYVSSKVNVTNAGLALLSDETIDEDVWLRQLLKIQYPNCLPSRESTAYFGFSLIPFPAFLKILKGCEGVSKDEGFIVNTITSSDPCKVDDAINHILEFRKRLKKDKSKGRNKICELINNERYLWASKVYDSEIKKRFRIIRKYIDESNPQDCKKLLSAIVKGGKGSNTKNARQCAKDLHKMKKNSVVYKIMKKRFLSYFLKMKTGSWGDYIDATSRYFRMSGLITIRRNRVVLSEKHQEIIDWILSQSWTLKEDSLYLDYLHDASQPELPQDNVEFTEKKSEQVLTKIGDYIPKTDSVFLKEKIEKSKGNSLKSRRILFDLMEKDRELQELRYMEELHANPDSVEEVNNYFDSILSKDILGDRPSHLEWNTWRGFLCVDQLAKHPSQCRNFKIDEDLQPVSFAAGNRPDMVFYYDKYILVVEVTLTTGSNQYSVESEPVQRHALRIIEQEGNAKVYTLFIAPKIDINTAMHFYTLMTQDALMDKASRIVRPKIIPFTLKEFKEILEIFRRERFTPENFENLLQMIIALQNNISIKNGALWSKEIPRMIEEWKETL